MMKWYEQLKSERISRGWTQRLLAEKIGTNKFTVSRWENGVAFPTRFYREKLATLLEIDFEEREFVQTASECDHNTPDTTLHSKEQSSSEPTSEVDPGTIESLKACWYEQTPPSSEGEPVHYKHNASLPLLTPVAQPQLTKSLAQDAQAHEQETHQATDHLFSSLSLRDLALGHCRRVLTFQPPHRFFWHLLLVPLMVLFAVLISMTTVSTLIRLSFLGMEEKQENQTNPYSTNLGTLMLNDSLSGANDYLPTSPYCAFTGGTYHITIENGSYTTCAGGPFFSNFAIEVQMTTLQGNCGGIMFRDDMEGHYYLFEVCSNGLYGVYRYFGQSVNDYQTLQLSSSSAIKKGLNQSNLIAAVAINQQIHLYVNRQSVSVLQDQSYSTGKIGLIADGSPTLGGLSSSTDVAYSNLRVWATEEAYGPPSYMLAMQNTDPSLQSTAQHLDQAFSSIYAQLVILTCVLLCSIFSFQRAHNASRLKAG